MKTWCNVKLSIPDGQFDTVLSSSSQFDGYSHVIVSDAKREKLIHSKNSRTCWDLNPRPSEHRSDALTTKPLGPWQRSSTQAALCGGLSQIATDSLSFSKATTSYSSSPIWYHSHVVRQLFIMNVQKLLVYYAVYTIGWQRESIFIYQEEPKHSAGHH